MRWESLKLNTTYNVVTLDYIIGAGDGYVPFLYNSTVVWLLSSSSSSSFFVDKKRRFCPSFFFCLFLYFFCILREILEVFFYVRCCCCRVLLSVVFLLLFFLILQTLLTGGDITSNILINWIKDKITGLGLPITSSFGDRVVQVDLPPTDFDGRIEEEDESNLCCFTLSLLFVYCFAANKSI
jgi:hypothetical protein